MHPGRREIVEERYYVRPVPVARTFGQLGIRGQQREHFPQRRALVFCRRQSVAERRQKSLRPFGELLVEEKQNVRQKRGDIDIPLFAIPTEIFQIDPDGMPVRGHERVEYGYISVRQIEFVQFEQSGGQFAHPLRELLPAEGHLRHVEQRELLVAETVGNGVGVEEHLAVQQRDRIGAIAHRGDREHSGDRMFLQYPQCLGVIPAAAAVQCALELAALYRQIQFAVTFEDRLRRFFGDDQGFVFFRQPFADTVRPARRRSVIGR